MSQSNIYYGFTGSCDNDILRSLVLLCHKVKVGPLLRDSPVLPSIHDAFPRGDIDLGNAVQPLSPKTELTGHEKKPAVRTRV
jgi:hypothetical protein